jgi:hypothetical protein
MLQILQNWSGLIQVALNPTGDIVSSPSEDSVQNIIQQSRQEKEQVVTLFLAGMLKRKKVKDKQQWVRITEAMLIELMDRIYTYEDTVKEHKSISYLCKAINNQLEDALNVIKNFFENYFNYDEKASCIYIENSLNKLARKAELLQEAVQPYSPYIHSLADIFTRNIQKFCVEKKADTTYREIFYQQELAEKLLLNEVLSSENLINEVLFYFNYNDHDYINYFFKT